MGSLALDPAAALDLVYIVDGPRSKASDRLEAVLRGGVGAIWLRMPEASGREVFDAAVALRTLTRRVGRALWIGDRLDVALAVDADAVQLGFRAPPAFALRSHFPRRLGVSCHDAASLAAAVRAGADHVVLSPVFSVPGKGPALGIGRFEALCRDVPIPVVALGGIDADNAAAVRAAGAAGVAVIRALAAAEDPMPTAGRLRA